MKKILMLTAALGTFATTADAARPFNGWSVGVHGGWNQDRLSDINNNTPGVDNSANFNFGVAGIHFNWTKSKMNDWLFGFGFGLGSHLGSPSKTIYESGNQRDELKHRRRFYIEGNLSAGWNFDNKWTVEGVLSVRGQRRHTSSTEYTNGVQTAYGSVSSFKYGVGPGARVTYRLNECWSAGGEFIHYFEQPIKDTSVDTDGSIKVGSNQALFKINYHF